MKQLELFETNSLKPIRKWLHVWSEAERARAIKNPTTRPPGNAVGNPENRVEENVTREEVMQLSGMSGVEPSNPRQRVNPRI